MVRLSKSCINVCNLYLFIKLDLFDVFFLYYVNEKMGVFFIIYNYLEIVFNGNGMLIICICILLNCNFK